MIINELQDLLKKSFYKHFFIEKKRENIYQVFLPLFYPDGDMIELFIQTDHTKKLTICDYGLTFMHLSYDIDIENIDKKAMFKTILLETGVSYNDGNIFIVTTPEDLYISIMQISQAIERIYDLRNYRHKKTNTHFLENLTEHVNNNLSMYKPQQNYIPIADMPDMSVDYRLTIGPKNIFLYGIQSDIKALSSLVSILSFRTVGLGFTSVVVYDDYSKLSLINQKKVMNATDKQFSDVSSFKKDGLTFLERISA